MNYVNKFEQMYHYLLEGAEGIQHSVLIHIREVTVRQRLVLRRQIWNTSSPLITFFVW